MKKIEEIYVEYSKQIYRYLISLTRNEHLSEELTQETFFIAVKKINQFRGECKIYTWLCQIAKNLYYKESKKQKKIDMIPLDILEETINNQDNNLEIETINKMDLYQKINSLDEKSRQVIYLRLIGEFSFKEIGEALNISENLARVIFYRGKRKIREGD